jgi:hypothetical protein
MNTSEPALRPIEFVEDMKRDYAMLRAMAHGSLNAARHEYAEPAGKP